MMIFAVYFWAEAVLILLKGCGKRNKSEKLRGVCAREESKEKLATRSEEEMDMTVWINMECPVYRISRYYKYVEVQDESDLLGT